VAGYKLPIHSSVFEHHVKLLLVQVENVHRPRLLCASTGGIGLGLFNLPVPRVDVSQTAVFHSTRSVNVLTRPLCDEHHQTQRREGFLENRSLAATTSKH